MRILDDFVDDSMFSCLADTIPFNMASSSILLSQFRAFFDKRKINACI